MKVLVIGGETSPDPNEKATLNVFCHGLGQVLGHSEHRIVVCSEHESSADRAVLNGLKGTSGCSSKGKVIVHRPDDRIIRNHWRTLEGELGLIEPEHHFYQGPEFRSRDGQIISTEGLRLAFLLCQMKALRDCDAVIAVGGKTDGAAVMLLAIARDEGRTLVPYRFLGGAAERAFGQLEGELKARLDDDCLDKLSDSIDGAAVCLDIIDRLKGVGAGASPRIFLSYPWKRSEYADLVEVILRRRSNVSVFRDERHIRLGESLEQRIQLEIERSCNIFIALWGREYVESPYCHDEMEMWFQRYGREGLYLLRFDETRPVWRSLRRAEHDREAFCGNWPLVGTDREKIRGALWQLLDEFELRTVTRKPSGRPT